MSYNSLAPCPVSRVVAVATPRVGVMKVGLVVKATTPVPLSSESHPANCAEVAKSEEVAVSTQAEPLCMRMSPYTALVMVTSERSLMPEEETALRQLPPWSRKQPPERMIPFAKVDDAEVEVMLSAADCKPVKVDVPDPVTESVPCISASLVVVALPKMVRPVDEVPPPMVEEATARREVKTTSDVVRTF